MPRVGVMVTLQSYIAKLDHRSQWTASNTIYPTQQNFEGILNSLIKNHGRKITLEDVNKENYQQYKRIREGVEFDTFLAQYSTVYHMWGLYYLDANDVFFITPLALQFYRKEITYQGIMLLFCSRYQFSKPQVYRQPPGPFRPSICLIQVFKALSQNAMDAKMSTFEINLFGCYFTEEGDVEGFLEILKSHRSGNESIDPKFVSRTTETNAMKSIIRMMKIAEIIHKNKKNGKYELVEK